MSEVKQFRLPDVGEGLTEADIVSWHVKPGDAVKVNQIIVEIETAKAVVELPSPYEGIVTGLLVEEGANVPVGTPIIAVDVAPDGARLDDLLPAPSAESAVEPGIHGSPAPKVERQAVLVGYGVKLGTTKRRQRKPAQSTPSAQAQPPPAPADVRVFPPSMQPATEAAPGGTAQAPRRTAPRSWPGPDPPLPSHHDARTPSAHHSRGCGKAAYCAWALCWRTAGPDVSSNNSSHASARRMRGHLRWDG